MSSQLIEMINRLPARVLLERLSVPVIVHDRTGGIVFANQAFAAMLGQDRRALDAMRLDDVVWNPPGPPWQTLGESGALELRHAEGHVVHTQAGGSVFLRDDDPVQLVTFHDVTELVWSTGHRRHRHA